MNNGNVENGERDDDVILLGAEGDINQDDLCAIAEILSSTFKELIVDEAVPGTWENRAKKAWQCYIEEPVVNNVINAWRALALGDGVIITCDDKDVQSEVRETAERLKLQALVRDSITNLLVKGDAICWKGRSRDGKDISEVVCVNPVSVKVKYENGVLIDAVQHPDFGEPISLPPESVLHLKWNTPSYNARGNSMITAAFEAIELMRDYRTAQAATAKRWTTPLRFIQVGGAFGNKIIMPDQKTLNAVRDMMNRLDIKAGTVVPPWIKVRTYGAEGSIPNFEAKYQEAKEDVIVALGMAKSIVTGDGANFKTASLAWKKMVVMLKEIRQAARDILNWALNDWLEMKGYRENSLHYIFSDLDLIDDAEIKKLNLALYDRGVASKETTQLKMGLNPDVENALIEKESKQPIDVRDPREIITLVLGGIMSPEEAGRRLGLSEGGGGKSGNDK